MSDKSTLKSLVRELEGSEWDEESPRNVVIWLTRPGAEDEQLWLRFSNAHLVKAHYLYDEEGSSTDWTQLEEVRAFLQEWRDNPEAARDNAIKKGLDDEQREDKQRTASLPEAREEVIPNLTPTISSAPEDEVRFRPDEYAAEDESTGLPSERLAAVYEQDEKIRAESRKEDARQNTAFLVHIALVLAAFMAFVIHPLLTIIPAAALLASLWNTFRDD